MEPEIKNKKSVSDNYKEVFEGSFQATGPVSDRPKKPVIEIE